MPTPPQDTAQLLELVSKSGLLSRDKLNDAQQLARDSTTVIELAAALVRSGNLTSWQAQQLLKGFSAFWMGDGQYLLLDELPGWPFGRVFKARTQDGQLVLFKLVSPEISNDESVKSALQESANRSAQLVHFALGPTASVKMLKGRVALIYRIPGEQTIAQAVQRWGQPSGMATLDMLDKLAQAVELLHKAGEVHGWITPSSLWLSEQGQLVLADVGLAALVASWIRQFGNSSDAQQWLPPAGSMAIPSVAGDLFMIGRTWAYLLEAAETGQSAEAPQWWRDGRNVADHELLRSLVARLTNPNTEGAIPSVATLVDACRQMVDRGSSEPTTSAARSSEEKPAMAVASASEPPVPAPSASTLDAQLSQPAGRSTNTVTINIVTRPKQLPKNDSSASTPPEQQRVVTGRTRSAWLLWVCGVGVVVSFLIVGSGLWWKYTRGNRPASVAGGNRPRPSATKQAAESSTPEVDAPKNNGPPTAQALPEPPPDPLHLRAGGGLASAPPAAKEQGHVGDSSAMPQQPATADDQVSDQAATKTPAQTEEVHNRPSESPRGAESSSPTQAASSTPVAPSQPAAVPAQETTNNRPAPAADLNVLPSSVALPTIDNTHWTRLAQVSIDDESPIVFDLLGADRIAKGVSFQLSNARGGTEARMWDVSLSEGMQSRGRTLIAQFRLLGGSFDFRWTPEAEPLKLSPLLANCLIQARSGNQRRLIALRQVNLVRPVKLDMDRGTFTARYEVPHLPDPGSCRFEVLRISNDLLFKADPDRLIPASSGKQWILFGKERQEQNLALHLAVSLRGNLAITGNALFQWGEDPSEEWLESRDRRAMKANRIRLVRELPRQLQVLKAQVDHYSGIDPKRIPDRTQSEQIARAKNLALTDYNRLNDQWKKVKAVEQLCEQLEGQSLHFRLVFEVEGNTVELLRTQGATETK